MKICRISIMGFGAVGQGLARVLIAKKEYLNKQGIDLKVIGIVDSRGSMVDTDGIDLESALLRKKQNGTVATGQVSAAELVRNIEHDIVVDVTPTNIEDGEQDSVTCFQLSVREDML